MEMMPYLYTLMVLFGALGILAAIEELMHWWLNR